MAPRGRLQDELDAAADSGEDKAVDAVERILAAGAAQKASDIHLEPFPDGVKIRMRVDGILRDAALLPAHMREGVTARLKVISQLATYRQKLPQDGRTRISHEGRGLDLRFAFFPTLHGEKVVIRFMNPAEAPRRLAELGLPDSVGASFLERLERNQGAILVTGPAGSGKTTTLYAALRHVQESRRGGVNIMTLEDPVEHDLGDICQSQVNLANGVTFSSGLRALLRQDPDVIMIGEVRDRETAEIAVQAALTGHLILSTIHSGSCVGVFTRLLNLSIEPYLVASAITAVISQRLVPRLCPKCREAYAPESRLLRRLPGRERFADAPFYRGKGCASCAGTGAAGRVALFELLAVDDAVRGLVMKGAPAPRLAAALRRKGLRTLLDDGLGKVLDGSVALEEVLRVA